MAWRVLISAPYILPVVDRFRPFFDAHDIEPVIAEVNERLDESDLLRLLPGCHGILCGDDRVTARVLDAVPDLRVIVKWGTGIDSIDAVAAKARGIPVRRTRNAFSEPVADSVLGYFLAFSRSIPSMDRAMRQGVWSKIPGRALNESTIGVVGLGDVGQAVLRRARPFGARMLGCDIRDVAQEATDLGVQLTTLEVLLSESDFVTLNCDLNETSYHLINKKTLSLFQPHAVLVNTSRGPVVCEKDLVNALRDGTIAGAGLDVFEEEPLPKDSALRTLSNCLIAPHNSNSSPKAWEAVHKNSLDMLVEGLSGRGR
jgi:D-3-phosphoglycerate dehydrogenase